MKSSSRSFFPALITLLVLAEPSCQPWPKRLIRTKTWFSSRIDPDGSTAELLPVPFCHHIGQGERSRHICGLQWILSIVVEKGCDHVQLNRLPGCLVPDPDTLKENRYPIVQLMSRILQSPGTVVFPWPSKEHFKIEFLANGCHLRYAAPRLENLGPGKSPRQEDPPMTVSESCQLSSPAIQPHRSTTSIEHLPILSWAGPGPPGLETGDFKNNLPRPQRSHQSINCIVVWPFRRQLLPLEIPFRHASSPEEPSSPSISLKKLPAGPDSTQGWVQPFQSDGQQIMGRMRYRGNDLLQQVDGGVQTRHGSPPPVLTTDHCPILIPDSTRPSSRQGPSSLRPRALETSPSAFHGRRCNSELDGSARGWIHLSDPADGDRWPAQRAHSWLITASNAG